ncbi:hypothetical protein EKO27_g10138 [Xylaria grammica]|uniref:HNH domain-containing protein n=1 Tax=Xylaria grammica TaxID=363999 RepID=A0A439CS08_9PEZI|nr:hypothetical protein EKO27_g10138 [Xylaria grammica]
MAKTQGLKIDLRDYAERAAWLGTPPGHRRLAISLRHSAHEETQGTEEFLAPVLTAYLTSLSTAPPPPSTRRADVCEICGHDWIRLSYHHRIPCSAHAKTIRRGWRRACDLQNAAWLCKACHRFVHCFTDHGDLARRFHTVKLLAADKVKEWADWVATVRIH